MMDSCGKHFPGRFISQPNNLGRHHLPRLQVGKLRSERWADLLKVTRGSVRDAHVPCPPKPTFYLLSGWALLFPIISPLLSLLAENRGENQVGMSIVGRYGERFSSLGLLWVFSSHLESVTITFVIIVYSVCVYVCVCTLLLHKLFEWKGFVFLNHLSFSLPMQDFSRRCKVHYP